MVDFIFVVIELFRYLLRLRHYKRKSVEVGISEVGWVTFGEYLTGNGASSTNQCWCRKTRVIAISCGINISTLHHLVLSQYTHLTHRWMDGQMDRIVTAIPCVALHAAP